MDSYWIAWAKFAEQIGVPIENQEHFSAYTDYVKNCSVSYFYPGFAFVSDRPVILRKDPETRLHCEDGPALAFKDGYEVYTWHGQNVPAEWINDPKSLSSKDALTWENIEQRRAAFEILGWDHILTELNAKTINKDDDPEIGELLEANIPDIGGEKFLRVQCGTGRHFAIPVPPEMKTALEAQAWMVGLDPVDFTKPELRT